MRIGWTVVAFLSVGISIAAGLFFLFYQDYTSSTGGAQYSKLDVSKEMARLASLSSEERISVDDLAGLRSMLKGDSSSEHELEEVEKLIQYGEYRHATHTLAFLDSYVETGKETICPGHELAHYYVWKKHGEDEMAEEALDEAKEQMDEWQDKARSYYERYPGEFTFDYILERINGHLDSIEANNTATTDEEITFLAEKSVCV